MKCVFDPAVQELNGSIHPSLPISISEGCLVVCSVLHTSSCPHGTKCLYQKTVCYFLFFVKVSHAHLHLASPWSVCVQWTNKWIIETYACSLSFLWTYVHQTSRRSYIRPSWLHFSSCCCDGDKFCLALAGFMKVPAPWLKPMAHLALPSPRFSDV